ncbi:MAG: metal ABC transporter substrate-binding protein [Reyranellaceae bacterium]
MSRRVALWQMLVAVAVFGLTPGALQAQPKPKVVASFSILADMAREIGGERVEVQSLVGPDGDAHVFQPSPNDARAVAQAAVLIVNGLGFEGWLDRLQRSAGFKGRLVVASTGIAPLTMEEDDHGHGHSHGHSHGGTTSTRKKAKAATPVSDPHAWQDLANGRAYVDNIARGLAEADPAGAAFYAQRAAAYQQRLAALDARLRRDFAAIAREKRRVITSHDAFAYFGKAYGVEFIPAIASSGDAEPSARQIAALIAQIRKENVKALFVENMSSPRLIEQIGRDAGASLGGTLYSDALSPPGGPADSYVKMFEHNAAMLQAGMARN